ncbi:tetratricopeptide repeat protein [Lacinutrix sp. C3R15]|uniref:tetratricopeptide repeat protein n=1 Tax=Flavobacteriaceae TaxID=49546 RepID=UPI001C0A65C3|nr:MULTISPECIES: tetratricopeptide repeat protein [Flavobacteriaceae]MBU2938837.1 tetratricopeptide repeat protein [Lacinutrix sp. C3R15]MDO6622150.1 tetratricopeptide repeat protein [Oceanihabitans sp. 1_MG-2023]
MKPAIIVFLAFLSVHYTYGQAYKDAFRADICQCLENESLKRNLTPNAYKNCFKETLPKYANQIDAAIVEQDLNKRYYLGQLERKNLVVAFQYELIYSCKVYFDYLDRKRTSEKLIAREQAKESDLETRNQMVAMSPNAYAYFYRAQLYFNLGNLKEAEADIKKSLEVNVNASNIKSTRHELLLLAWVYEEQEQFTKAIAIYDKIYMGDYDLQVATLRALADKKSGGNMSSIPKLDGEIKPIINNKKDRRKPTIQNTNTTTKEQKTQTKKKTDSSSLKKLFKL